MPASRHPLDPLSAAEISAASAVIRREKGADACWRFAMVSLREPSKDALRGWSTGDAITRRADVVCWNRSDGVVQEGIVDLTADRVESWIARPGVQANFHPDECYECDAMLRGHRRPSPPLPAAASPTSISCCSTSGPTAARSVPERYRAGGSAGPTSGSATSPDSNPYAQLIPGCIRSST